METISKKYIIAERNYESSISENLSILCVTDFSDIKVLSLYSDLSKKLLAYKLIQQNSEYTDSWLSTSFLKTLYMDFNPDFELIPTVFAENPLSEQGLGFVVHPESKLNHIHYSKGLAVYNALRQEENKVYLFGFEGKLTIVIFKSKNCVFSNTFAYSNETEILYFIMNAIEISDLKQDDVNVFLDYNLAGNAALKDFLQSYFQNLENMKPMMDDPDTEIPFLSELLFPNYLISLCG